MIFSPAASHAASSARVTRSSNSERSPSKMSISTAIPARSMEIRHLCTPISTSCSSSDPPRASTSFSMTSASLVTATALSIDSAKWSSPKSSMAWSEFSSASPRATLRWVRTASSNLWARRSGCSKYEASSVSQVRPATSQPRSARASTGPLAECMTLGRSLSASQAAKTSSSSGLNSAASNHTALPSTPPSATASTSPDPLPQLPVTSTPMRPAVVDSQSFNVRGSRTVPEISRVSSTSSTPSASDSVARARTRSHRVRNSRVSKTARVAFGSQG